MPGQLIPYMVVALDASVMATVFAYGTRASADDVFYVLRRPRLLVESLIAMFVVVPAAALFLSATIDMPRVVRVAMIAMAISPISLVLTRKQRGAGGHHPYAVGLNFTVIVLSIVITPSLVWFLGRLLNHPFALEASAVARVVVGLGLLPLSLGILCRRARPALADRIAEPLFKAANVVTLVALFTVFVLALPVVWGFASVGIVLVFAAYSVLALAVGDVMGGPYADRSVVLALSCATRNPAVPLAIAAANFPGEQFAAAVVLLMIVNGVVSTPYLKWRTREPLPSGREAPVHGPDARPTSAGRPH